MDFNEDDIMYEDDSVDSGSGSSILDSLFGAAAQVGTSYFNSTTPQVVNVSPYGATNPATGLPYGAPVAPKTSPIIWILILGAVGYVAYKNL